MYQKKWRGVTSLRVYEAHQDETIETKIAKMMEGSDTVTDTKELVFYEEGEGVQGFADIRHDYWDEARTTSSMAAERDTKLDAQRLTKRKETMKEEKDRAEFIKKQHEEAFKESKNPKKNGGETGGQE